MNLQRKYLGLFLIAIFNFLLIVLTMYCDLNTKEKIYAILGCSAVSIFGFYLVNPKIALVVFIILLLSFIVFWHMIH